MNNNNNDSVKDVAVITVDISWLVNKYNIPEHYFLFKYLSIYDFIEFFTSIDCNYCDYETTFYEIFESLVSDELMDTLSSKDFYNISLLASTVIADFDNYLKQTLRNAGLNEYKDYVFLAWVDQSSVILIESLELEVLNNKLDSNEVMTVATDMVIDGVTYKPGDKIIITGNVVVPRLTHMLNYNPNGCCLHQDRDVPIYKQPRNCDKVSNFNKDILSRIILNRVH